MKKILKITFLFFLLLISTVTAIIVDEFDDATSNFNITTNTSKTFTLAVNATVGSANLSIEGFKSFTYCYQEQANISTECGGVATGNYFEADIAGDKGYLYMNYTKPLYSTNSSLWQIKTGAEFTNISIPADCFDANNEILELRIESLIDDSPVFNYYNATCKNSTNWKSLRRYDDSGFGSSSLGTGTEAYDSSYVTAVGFRDGFGWTTSGEGAAMIYEEAMNWALKSYPQNVSIFINNTRIFNHPVNLTTRNESIDLNATLIQNILISNATVPIKITADNFGKINLFNLSVFYEANVLKLTFYDESTDTKITDSIELLVISDNFNENYTVTDGNINVTSLPNEELELRYNGVGYRENTYFVTYTGFETEIDLYAVKNTSSSLILFEIINEKGDAVKNGTLKRLRYMLNDNAYILVGMERIDTNGQSGMYLVPNDVPYQFIIEKSGVTLGSFGPQKIFLSTVQFTVKQLEDVLQSWSILIDQVSTSLSWNNDTNIVTYTWNDASGLVTEGCIEITERQSLQDVTYGPTCASAATGSVQLDMSSDVGNYTYYAKGYLTTNTRYSNPVTDLLTKTFAHGYGRYSDYGLFLAYILIGTAFFIGIPFNFTIALIYSVVSMLLLNVFGLSFFGVGFITVITIIGFAIAVVNKI